MNTKLMAVTLGACGLFPVIGVACWVSGSSNCCAEIAVPPHMDRSWPAKGFPCTDHCRDTLVTFPVVNYAKKVSSGGQESRNFGADDTCVWWITNCINNVCVDEFGPYTDYCHPNTPTGATCP